MENKKRRYKLDKHSSGRIAALVLAGIMTVSIVSCSLGKKSATEDNSKIVTQYYGDNSEEGKLFDYIFVSKKLNSMKLDKFIIDNSLYEQLFSSNIELANPQDIDKAITKYEASKYDLDQKDLVKSVDFIKNVLFLTAQEKEVNSYIYNVGYKIANMDIKNATKKYAGELYGINDYDNIIFDSHSDISSGESSYIINYDYNRGAIHDRTIQNGIDSMNQTNIDYDPDSSDNYKYNESRNERIAEAILDSIEINKKVNNEDLYNEKASNRLKK